MSLQTAQLTIADNFGVRHNCAFWAGIKGAR
jgi:para-nitrobenzyl esterase